MDIRVLLGEKTAQPVDDPLRLLRRGGAVEVDEAWVRGKDRELVSDVKM
jgi:hypothetical protein